MIIGFVGIADVEAPYIQFIETTFHRSVLFDEAITVGRLLEMDDEHFDQIFDVEFGAGIKEQQALFTERFSVIRPFKDGPSWERSEAQAVKEASSNRSEEKGDMKRS